METPLHSGISVTIEKDWDSVRAASIHICFTIAVFSSDLLLTKNMKIHIFLVQPNAAVLMVVGDIPLPSNYYVNCLIEVSNVI